MILYAVATRWTSLKSTASLVVADRTVEKRPFYGGTSHPCKRGAVLVETIDGRRGYATAGARCVEEVWTEFRYGAEG